MNFKQWGTGLRMLFAVLLSLPLIGFAVIAWSGFLVISDLVEVAKKSIIELPAEKGVEVANTLARVHDKSEVLMFFVPLASALGMVVCFGVLYWKFFSKLTAECATLISSARQMSGLGDHLSHSAQKLTLGATQSSAALEQSLGSVEHLSSALQKTAIDIGEADKAARVAAEEALRGEGELQTIVDSLAELSSQSRKLEEIINVIDSIAFQTNILAVNAAVEAARAGEQGRGFAIVAEAVRNLAQHSAASAKNITALIRDSGETSKKAMHAVRSGAANLGMAVNQVKKSQLLIHKISTTTHDLTQALTLINQSLSHLDSTTRNVFHSGDASPEALESIRSRISTVQGCVNSLSVVVLNSEATEEFVVESKSTSEAVTSGQTQTTVKKPEAKIVERIPVPKSTQSNTQIRRMAGSESANKPSRLQSVSQASANKPKPQVKLRARDVIPFEGESESETSTDVKLGTTSGF